MTVVQIITVVILAIAGVISFVFAITHFMEKGPLFNNEFIKIPMLQQDKVDKKPYYRQSAYIFLAAALIFASVTLHYATGDSIFMIIEIVLFVATLAYAYLSSKKLRENTKRKFN